LFATSTPDSSASVGAANNSRHISSLIINKSLIRRATLDIQTYNRRRFDLIQLGYGKDNLKTGAARRVGRSVSLHGFPFGWGFEEQRNRECT
jgi:hypothetical protein